VADQEDLPPGNYYFVHYKGWKQSWDEWVNEDRVMKITPENLIKQQELKDFHSDQKKKPTEKKVADVKKRRISAVEKEEEYLKRPEVRIAIPDSLKTQLVEDWENVTKNQKLVILPRETTVLDILNDFREAMSQNQKRRIDGRTDDSLEEVIQGLLLYFDKALGKILLYRFERLQYVQIRKSYPDKQMSEIYGAEHFLRLFGITF
jgi:mortality factor 4-like protein 1